MSSATVPCETLEVTLQKASDGQQHWMSWQAIAADQRTALQQCSYGKVEEEISERGLHYLAHRDQ